MWSPLIIVFFLESFNLSTIWTSAKRPEGGAINEFYWTNSGKPLVYENWREDQPYTAISYSDCVSITKEFQYKWDDTSCQYMFFTTLCEWWGILQLEWICAGSILQLKGLCFNTLINCFRFVKNPKIKLFLPFRKS